MGQVVPCYVEPFAESKQPVHRVQGENVWQCFIVGELSPLDCSHLQVVGGYGEVCGGVKGIGLPAVVWEIQPGVLGGQVTWRWQVAGRDVMRTVVTARNLCLLKGKGASGLHARRDVAVNNQIRSIVS
jgi:hypothetical protein